MRPRLDVDPYPDPAAERRKPPRTVLLLPLYRLPQDDAQPLDERVESQRQPRLRLVITPEP